MGVALPLDDAAWEPWAVGGAADAREMLLELSRKRRVLWGETAADKGALGGRG